MSARTVALTVLATLLLVGGTAGMRANAEVRHAVPRDTIARLAAARIAAEGKITYAKAGDSTTAMADSWANQMSDPTLVDVGGYARGGMRSDQILAGIQPGYATVLEIMVGVNDVNQGVPAATTLANVEAIVAKYAGAKHVLVAAIVPSNVTRSHTGHFDRRALGAALNVKLAALAAAHGWSYGDPDSQFRRANNGYRFGWCISDGVHPTERAYRSMAVKMAALIHTAAGQ